MNLTVGEGRDGEGGTRSKGGGEGETRSNTTERDCGWKHFKTVYFFIKKCVDELKQNLTCNKMVKTYNRGGILPRLRVDDDHFPEK